MPQGRSESLLARSSGRPPTHLARAGTRPARARVQPNPARRLPDSEIGTRADSALERWRSDDTGRGWAAFERLLADMAHLPARGDLRHRAELPLRPPRRRGPRAVSRAAPCPRASRSRALGEGSRDRARALRAHDQVRARGRSRRARGAIHDGGGRRGHPSRAHLSAARGGARPVIRARASSGALSTAAADGDVPV